MPYAPPSPVDKADGWIQRGCSLVRWDLRKVSTEGGEGW